MDPFILEATEITPKVILNKDKGIFSIEGKSLPEDVKDFYTPIIDWFERYSRQPNQETLLVLGFEYFNTASSKMLLIILSIMRSLKGTGYLVSVIWKFPQYDVELEEAGEELSELLDIPFKIIPIVT